jgi:GDP/UDP-N,N'-diacetylbacillosamine 2-epimerase (hydrolysing)
MNNKRKKIVLFSGKRGGFSHFVPILNNKNFKKNFDLILVLSDMHLSKEFGSTKNEVYQYFRNTISLKKKNVKDSDNDRIKLIIGTIYDLEKVLLKINPDLVIVLGDRSETLAAAVTSSYLKIPLLHIYGGDISQGGTDETARHAITKLSNFHIVSNYDSKKNVLQMGEEKWRVFNTGFLTFDLFNKKFFFKKDEIFHKFNLKKNLPVIILIQHPNTWDVKNSRKQIKETLLALKEVKTQTIAIYPCSDPGHSAIIQELRDFQKKNKNFQLHKNIEMKEFYSLYKYSNLIVGNSSSGITESLFFKKFSINIGTRQYGRLCSKNVYHAKNNKDEILKYLKRLLKKKIKLNSKNENFYYKKNSTDGLFKFIKKNISNKKKAISKSFIKINSL